MRLGYVLAGNPFHAKTVAQGLLTLLAQRLALARGECGQEIGKGGVALIAPVKLLVGSLQKAACSYAQPFGLAEKSYMYAR